MSDNPTNREANREVDPEAHLLHTLYGTRLYRCPCGCTLLISPDRPEGPFATWVQGCEEERRLYKGQVIEATTYVSPRYGTLEPDPLTLSHASALHHNHLYDALLSLGNGSESLLSLIYYPFGGLPADWHDRLGWRISNTSPDSNK